MMFAVSVDRLRHALASSCATVIALCLCTTMVATSQASASPHPPGPLFSVLGSPVYVPVVNSKTLTLRIPLLVRHDVSVKHLETALDDVELPGRREAVVFDAFKVAVAPATANPDHTATIFLTVDESTPLAPGAYRVRFTVFSDRPSGLRRLAVDVNLTAPQLAVPPTVYINNTVHQPESSTESSRLVLRETSGRARLTGLSIVQVQGPQSVDQSTDGTVVVAKPPTVLPGQSGVADISLKGKFPLGTSTGELEVYSPQLAAPVPIAFQVETRAWKLYLVLAIVAGVAFGFITRVWLAQRIERGKARVQAYGLLAQMEQERRHFVDPAFGNDLEGAAQKLERVLQAGTGQEITTAFKAAQRELAEAQNKLKASTGKTAGQLAKMEQTLCRSWVVPAQINDLVTDGRRALQSARGQLEAGDVQGATNAIDNLETRLSANIQEAGSRWRAEATKLVESLQEAQPGVLGNASPSLSASTQTANTLIEETVADNPTAKIEEVLTRFHNAVASLTAVLNQLPPIVELQTRRTIELLNPALTDNDRATLAEGANRLSETLKRADATEAATFQPVENTLCELSERLARVILKHATRKRTTVQKTLEHGDFIEAAGLVAHTQPAQTSSAEAGSFSAPIVAIKMTASLARASAEMAGAEPPHQEPTADVPTQSFAPAAEAMQVRAIGELARDQRLQTVLIGIVVVLVGYLVRTDNFVGTTGDFLGAFGWGYTADITTAFVITSLSGRTAQPGGAAAQPAV